MKYTPCYVTVKEKKTDPVRIWNLMFNLFVSDDFRSSNAKEVLGVYPPWKMQRPILIARWSFILKTLRNIHGRWTLIRVLLTASD